MKFKKNEKFKKVINKVTNYSMKRITQFQKWNALKY